MFEVVLFLLSSSHLLSHCVHSGASSPTAWTFSLAFTLWVPSRHELIKIIVRHIIALFADALFEHVDLLHVFSLLRVLGLLLEVLQCLVEFLVFSALLLLLKGLDFDLLLQKSRFDIGHMLIRLEHLSEEVIWATDGHLRLDKELHALHHVFSS